MNLQMNIYKMYIVERYRDLKNKPDINNYDLAKIFEYYTCIRLFEEYARIFYEYNDIDPNFKEENGMTRYDSGIDCCDLEKTIVQCKLRSKSLTWEECGTFFGSQIIFDNKMGEKIIRWTELIIARNECTLSRQLIIRQNLFVDKVYPKQQLIDYCEQLLLEPPILPIVKNDFIIHDIKEIGKNNLININKICLY